MLIAILKKFLQMSGRGRGRGRGRGQPPDEEPTVDQEIGLGQIPQLVAATLTAFATRMEALFAGGGVTPPPRTPEAPAQPGAGAAVIAPVVPPEAAAAAAEQEIWLCLVERYQKLRAPEFSGGSDPLVADKWKEDVGNILDLMGVDPIQRQRLAAFSLKGDANKWYRAQFSAADRLTIGWDEFLWRFDLQFISSAAKAGKEAELLRLEQGEMSVAEYESKFTRLLHFTGNMFQIEER